MLVSFNTGGARVVMPLEELLDGVLEVLLGSEFREEGSLSPGEEPKEYPQFLKYTD